MFKVLEMEASEIEKSTMFFLVVRSLPSFTTAIHPRPHHWFKNKFRWISDLYSLTPSSFCFPSLLFCSVFFCIVYVHQSVVRKKRDAQQIYGTRQSSEFEHSDNRIGNIVYTHIHIVNKPNKNRKKNNKTTEMPINGNRNKFWKRKNYSRAYAHTSTTFFVFVVNKHAAAVAAAWHGVKLCIQIILNDSGIVVVYAFNRNNHHNKN